MSYDGEDKQAIKEVPAGDVSSAPHRTLSPFWRYLVIVVTAMGLFAAVNQVFILRLLGHIELQNATIYFYFAIFLSIVFIIYPGAKRSSRTSVPWYDVMLFCLTFGISTYFIVVSWDITYKGWDFQPPFQAGILAAGLCLIVLETVRRVGGNILLAICIIFALYPTFAGHLPGLLQGFQLSLWNTLSYHAMGLSSLMGLTTGIFGLLLVGFMFFGVVLITTGGGQFFINIAYALFGTQRGGPAKVSIFSSALFASISGSVIANVVTTGSITIPAMKKVGYPAHFAAAVEACASTGGTITPPIMGATAFIMAAWLNMPYFQVAIAAAIPAFLYYVALFTQVDAYAATHKLVGIDRSKVPSLTKTILHGWPFILSFATLLYFMYLRRESQAPFMASGIMLLSAMLQKHTRIYLKDFLRLLEEAGRVLSMIMPLLAGIGFIVGSFAVTGLGLAFSSEVVHLAGDNWILLLALGAIGSFVLGMGMTVTACYIFLALVLAPALIALDFNPLAVHLFVIYWGVASFITPPVALGAYTASTIAGASSSRTGFQAMRLGIVVYLVPFIFVLNPALVLQGSLSQLALLLPTALVGIWLIGSGLEGYVLGLGRMLIIPRVITFIAGLGLAVPYWEIKIGGAIALTIAIIIHIMTGGLTRHRQVQT
ncbi:TRAP transporter permease [Chloroflexota bacterium]